MPLSVGFPSHCGLTFNEWVDRAAKRGTISNMQPTMLDVPLSSKEMCNIIENDRWKRLGFSRSVSHYPCFEQCYKVCVEFSIQTKLSKHTVYICKKKLSVYHILFSCQLMKSCLPPEWLSNGNVQLFYEIFCLKRNGLILSLAYHLINLSFT